MAQYRRLSSDARESSAIAVFAEGARNSKIRAWNVRSRRDLLQYVCGYPESVVTLLAEGQAREARCAGVGCGKSRFFIDGEITERTPVGSFIGNRFLQNIPQGGRYPAESIAQRHG